MTNEEYKDPKAWYKERDYDDVIKGLQALDNNHIDITSITDYVSALLEALRVVNRAACGSTYIGSEYWDERGCITGTLRAIAQCHEQRKGNWKAFLDERHLRNKEKRVRHGSMD